MTTQQLIPHLSILNGVVKVSSLQVAEHFGREHFHVLRDIKEVLTQVSDSFGETNFGLSEYHAQNNLGFPVKHPMYHLTKNGFMFLVMGFTGKEAARWKEAYIKAFDDLEAELKEMDRRQRQLPKNLPSMAQLLHTARELRAMGEIMGLKGRTLTVSINSGICKMHGVDMLNLFSQPQVKYSNQAKWQNVFTWIEQQPHLSDRAIARMCGVSNTFVGKVRKEVGHE